MSDTNELRQKAIAMVSAMHDLGGGWQMAGDISESMMWAASEIERLRTELSNAECKIEQLEMATINV